MDVVCAFSFKFSQSLFRNGASRDISLLAENLRARSLRRLITRVWIARICTDKTLCKKCTYFSILYGGVGSGFLNIPIYVNPWNIFFCIFIFTNNLSWSFTGVFISCMNWEQGHGFYFVCLMSKKKCFIECCMKEKSLVYYIDLVIVLQLVLLL